VIAINAIETGDDITVTLNKDSEPYKVETDVMIQNKVPVTFEAANGINPVIDGEESHRIFRISNEATATFKGITFKNGDAYGWGAALFISGRVELQGCTVTENTISSTFGGIAMGGAVYVSGNDSIVILKNTLIDNNAITVNGYDGKGGGVAVFDSADIIIENSTITNNTLNSGMGAGLYIKNGDSATLTNVAISGNTLEVTGSCGGGIYCSNSDSLTLDNCMITNNEAYSAGGIYATGIGSLEITDAVIASNVADSTGGLGGGLYLLNMVDKVKTNGTVWSDSISTIPIGTTNSPLSVSTEGEYTEPAIDTDPVQIYGNTASDGYQVYVFDE